MEAKRGQEWRRRKRHQWDKWMMFQWYEVFISTYRFLTERNMDGGVAWGSEAPFSHNCQPLPARLSFLGGTGDVRVFYLSQDSFFYPKSAWLKLHASDYEFWENNERRPQRSLSKPRGRQVSLQFRAYTFFGYEAKVDAYHNSFWFWLLEDVEEEREPVWRRVPEEFSYRCLSNSNQISPSEPWPKAAGTCFQILFSLWENSKDYCNITLNSLCLTHKLL